MMFSAFRNTALGLGATLIFAVGFGGPAQAVYVATLTQSAEGLVAVGSGTIDTAGLTPASCGVDNALISPITASVLLGPLDAVRCSAFSGITGPNQFGSGGGGNPNASSGSLVGVIGYSHLIDVPLGYVSGNPLSDTSTYDGQTFASLGATPGTYIWTWGTGANADSFTLQIGVPEPASLSLLAVSLAGIGAGRRRRA